MADPALADNTDTVADTGSHRTAAVFVGSDVFARSAFGGNHPLNFVRHAAVADLAAILGWLDDSNFRSIEPASVPTLLEFHDRSYVRALKNADAAGRVDTDIRNRYQIGTLENPLFPGMFERAATTVGGSILAAELALEGRVVFHPSGGTHHGRADRACGFCYFNDPVFAISTLLGNVAGKVLYIDLDAHHGDGVEEAFFADERVDTVSIHEADRWPHTGHRSYPDAGAFNLSVPVGINDSEFELLIDELVLPMASRDGVDALVLCCGADCLAGDPLSRMMLSNVTLWDTVRQLVALGKPTVVVGGGGYNPWTVARYWAGLWGVLSGQAIPTDLPAEATSLLSRVQCDLVDDDEIQADWLTTMADSPYRGPIRPAIQSLVDGFPA